MAYDLHGYWDSVTGHNAGLHKSAADGDRPREDLYTVDVALEFWIASGQFRKQYAITFTFDFVKLSMIAAQFRNAR